MGVPLWQTPLTPPGSQQGVFWVAVSNDKRFAAAGGETTANSTEAQGFLALCRGDTGAILQKEAMTSRVNQVSFSGDGNRLLAALSNSVYLYSTVQGKLDLLGQYDLPNGMVCCSALLSSDGQIAWLSGIPYPSGQGCVLQLGASFLGLTLVRTYVMPVGVMRVAISADGRWCAAALHDGSCALLEASQAAPCWHYTPTFASLAVAYAVAVTETADGRIVVACGVNAGGVSINSGYLYLLQSSASNVGPGEPSLSWYQHLEYSANPGVCLDADANLVTATDGKPAEQNGGSNQQESPGNFYLFSAKDGQLLFKLATTVMNWPMVITPTGRCLLGGSDNGTLYYWEQ
jgi:outer membrane protein assembly factor BamB